MSNLIPKEKMSAYQRWEMASFGESRPSTTQNPAEIARQQADDLARLREKVRLEAYAAGFEQGQAAGLDAGRVQVTQELQYLRQIAENFSSEIAQANETVSADMLDLALDISKAVLKTSLKVRPELILPIISEAIRYLPSVQQPALLVLNPEDARIVKTRMTDELDKAGWRITEDMQMERGGCRLETSSNQIDASLPVRWQRIAEALGKQTDWLE